MAFELLPYELEARQKVKRWCSTPTVPRVTIHRIIHKTIETVLEMQREQAAKAEALENAKGTKPAAEDASDGAPKRKPK